MYICSHSIYNQIKKDPHIDDISLDELKNLKNKFNITFDDGYASIYKYREILYQFKNKVIIFICPGFIEGDTNIWWLEIFDFIFQNNKEMNFSFQGKNYSFNLNSRKKKENCYKNLSKIFKQNNKEHNEELLNLIIKDRKKNDYRNKFLTWEMVYELSRSPNIIIGSHTYSHLNLKNENYSIINFELKKSKEIIENYIKKECKYFAFPYGGSNSFDAEIINQAYDLGYKHIFTTEPKLKSLKIKNENVINRLTSSPNIKNNILSLYLRFIIKLFQNIFFK